MQLKGSTTLLTSTAVWSGFLQYCDRCYGLAFWFKCNFILWENILTKGNPCLGVMTLCPHGKWEGFWGWLALVSVSPQTNFLQGRRLWCANFQSIYKSKKATHYCTICRIRTIPKYVTNLMKCSSLFFYNSVFNFQLSDFPEFPLSHLVTMWVWICINEVVSFCQGLFFLAFGKKQGNIIVNCQFLY